MTVTEVLGSTPPGKIKDAAKAFEILGVSPHLGENLSGSGDPERAGAFQVIPLAPSRGGVWLADLVIAVASR